MPNGRKWAQQAFVQAARRSPLVFKLIGSGGKKRATRIRPLLAPWLPSRGSVLDIGTGTGHLTEVLNGVGRRVVCCDVADLNLVGKLDCVADGACLPFRSAVFDAVLLVTVLHHIQAASQTAVLEESLRVLRPQGRLIVMEDTFHSSFERHAMGALDSLLSAEFVGHPHSNRTFGEWTALLTATGFRVLEREERTHWYGIIPIRHSLLIGEKRWCPFESS